MAGNHESAEYPAGGRVQVRIIESRKGQGESEPRPAPAVELPVQEARDYVEPFIEDGYVVVVLKRDGSGHVIRSKQDLPPDARTVLIIGGLPER